MVAGWSPGGRRVAAGFGVPIWGRCLFEACAEAGPKQVTTPLSRASFVWGKIIKNKNAPNLTFEGTIRRHFVPGNLFLKVSSPENLPGALVLTS